MRRLIDADELKERFCEENCGKNRCVDHMDKCVWILSVEESKTAFDLDKVVEQIESIKGKEQEACTDEQCENCKYFNDCWDGDMIDNLALDKAIEIVKGGGVE